MGLFNALVKGSLLPWNYWSNSNRETDYETVLSSLSKQVQQVEIRLNTIRIRERRASVNLTIHAFLIWAVYSLLCWYFGYLELRTLWSSFSSYDRTDQASLVWLVWFPVVVSPILIIFTRKIVRWWYRRIGQAEEKHLIDLRRKRRDKIEEIKRATRYDHLRLLLEKYDETRPPTTNPNQKQKVARESNLASGKKQQIPTPTKSQVQAEGPGGGGGPIQVGNTSSPSTPSRTQGGGGLQAPFQLSNPTTPSFPPTKRTWIDKLADAVLGAEDPSVWGPEQKYALICSRCFSHNGLATKEDFQEIQYICPKCGMFNSRRPSTVPVSSPFSSSHLTPKSKDASDSDPPQTPSVKKASEAGEGGEAVLRRRRVEEKVVQDQEEEVNMDLDQ